MPKPNGELSLREIERQDCVDNAVFRLILDCSPEEADINWDIELIGKIRDALQEVLVDDLKLMTEQEFYPYIELDDDGNIVLEPSDKPDETNEKGEWVVTVDQLEKAVMTAISQTDADEFAQLAGDSLGGYCRYNPLTQKYYFTPSLNYWGGLDFIKESS
jgi:hypothetical protein